MPEDKKKNKRRSPWLEIFDEIKKLEKMMDDLMKSIEASNKYNRRYRPFYGFSATFTRNRRLKPKSFRSLKRGYVTPEIRGEYEPLIDVFNEKERVRVFAEIPGACKDDVDIYVTEDTLRISVHTDNVKFYREIILPARVNPKTATATYKNGVLEIRLKKTSNKEIFGGQKIFVK